MSIPLENKAGAKTQHQNKQESDPRIIECDRIAWM